LRQLLISFLKGIFKVNNIASRNCSSEFIMALDFGKRKIAGPLRLVMTFSFERSKVTIIPNLYFNRGFISL